jgi:hypothetical protein
MIVVRTRRGGEALHDAVRDVCGADCVWDGILEPCGQAFRLSGTSEVIAVKLVCTGL